MGVVGTLFSDQLARGARGHVQEIDLTWPALPACNGARQHAHTRAWTWEVVFATAAKPGGGVTGFFTSIEQPTVQDGFGSAVS